MSVVSRVLRKADDFGQQKQESRSEEDYSPNNRNYPIVASTLRLSANQPMRVTAERAVIP
jgi:hypothetical protein